MTATDQRPPPHVLIIHDHTSVVNLISYLEENGMRVSNRSHDDDMLAAVLDIDPDIIVLDFAVDGDTVAALKGDGRTHHIPLIALADVCRLRPRG